MAKNEMGAVSARGLVLLVALFLPAVFASLIPNTVDMSVLWSTLYRAGLMACISVVFLCAALTEREIVAGMFVFFMQINVQHIGHLSGQSAYTFWNATTSGILFILVFLVARIIARKRVAKSA